MCISHKLTNRKKMRFSANGCGNSIFSDIRCVQFPLQRIWKFTLSAMHTCPISAQQDFEIRLFLQSGVPPVIPNRFGHSFFWNIFHFHPNKFGNSNFLNSGVPDFHHN